MSEEESYLIEKASGLFQLRAELSAIPQGDSPLLSEIINRSLLDLRKNNALENRHQIGSHKLDGPDYRLVCSWGEELKLTSEDVLERLLRKPDRHEDDGTILKDGKFRSLYVDGKILPISGVPLISGLVVETFTLRPKKRGKFSKLNLSSFPDLTKFDCAYNKLLKLDLSMVPKLSRLYCGSNRLKNLDLSFVPGLTELDCFGNFLNELELSKIPNLTILRCGWNGLTNLDLIAVPNLQELDCRLNKLTSLNLAPIPNLSKLACGSNSVNILDITPLKNLQLLDHFGCLRHIIQRPDQNFQ